MIIVEQETITTGWLDAVENLLATGGDAFTGVVHVTKPGEPVLPTEVRARGLLDSWLDGRDFYDTQTVANTIFPEFFNTLPDENEAYRRYRERLWPQIRRIRANSRGTYFLRLIGGRVEDSAAGDLLNPLAIAIQKLRTQLATGQPMRSAYELPIYSVLDRNVTMGFPCLSHVSLKLDAGRLHLTGFYRNQCYVRRLYGNLLGLARLQVFAARHAGLVPGELVCHASHAELETNGGLGSFRALIKECRQVLDV